MPMQSVLLHCKPPPVLLVHQVWMQLLGAVFAVPLNLPLLLYALLRLLWDIGFVHPNGLAAFVASRLIPLDKQPGVCRGGSLA